MPDRDAPEQPQVLFDRRGRAGYIRLNRPRTINALTHEMVHAIQRTLDEWAVDDHLTTVVLTGAGERGLCAGGDLVPLYRGARAGQEEDAARFWADEYRLNSVIAHYPKPFVAVMDGIVLGGGVGLAGHASHRVVTERSRVGMPETGIGFVPDVGGSWLLSRAPGQTGTLMALTADPVGAADAIALGFADHRIASSDIARLLVSFETEAADTAIARVALAPGDCALPAERGRIDEWFAGDDVVEMLQRLHAAGRDDAAALERRIRLNSPTALTVALASLRSTATMTGVDEALNQEYRVSMHAYRHADFVEGIRAQLIDKDRAPRWQPQDGAEVDPELVRGFFAPLDRAELGLSVADHEQRPDWKARP